MPGVGSAAFGMLTGLGQQALTFGVIGGGMFAGPGAGMAAGMLGGLGGMGHHSMPKVTYVWALPGLKSTVIAASSKPRFEMQYGNLLGIDPDAYEPFVVQLVQTKDNWRLVGATKTPMGQLSNEAYEKVTEVRLKSKCERMGPRGLMKGRASPGYGGLANMPPWCCARSIPGSVRREVSEVRPSGPYSFRCGTSPSNKSWVPEADSRAPPST